MPQAAILAPPVPPPVPATGEATWACAEGHENAGAGTPWEATRCCPRGREATWACGNTVCVFCGKTPGPPPEEEGEGGEWGCPICTFVNVSGGGGGGMEECAVCGASR